MVSMGRDVYHPIVIRECEICLESITHPSIHDVILHHKRGEDGQMMNVDDMSVMVAMMTNITINRV